MKCCFAQYRKGLYEKLVTLTYGGDSLRVYKYPPADAVMPYVSIESMTASPEEDATVFSQTVTTELHVVQEYFGDQATSDVIDAIADLVMELLITKGVTEVERGAAIAMTDFESTPHSLVTLAQETNWDDVHKEVRNIITIETLIDET